MIPYKFSNGRVMARDSRGRFRNFTFQEIFGIETNDAYLICSKCGYGKNDKWMPVLRTGKCPKCENQEGHKEKEILLNKKAEMLIERIDELERFIGKDLINPMRWNGVKDEYRLLQYELESELKKCIDESFK